MTAFNFETLTNFSHRVTQEVEDRRAAKLGGARNLDPLFIGVRKEDPPQTVEDLQSILRNELGTVTLVRGPGMGTEYRGEQRVLGTEEWEGMQRRILSHRLDELGVVLRPRDAACAVGAECRPVREALAEALGEANAHFKGVNIRGQVFGDRFLSFWPNEVAKLVNTVEGPLPEAVTAAMNGAHFIPVRDAGELGGLTAGTPIWVHSGRVLRVARFHGYLPLSHANVAYDTLDLEEDSHLLNHLSPRFQHVSRATRLPYVPSDSVWRVR